MKPSGRIDREFYIRDVLEIAPALLGTRLVMFNPETGPVSSIITETEAYRGEEDLACHVSRGRTARTEIMYHEGGVLYIYLIYGIHWMLNIVTGPLNEPQAVLIRGVRGISGPGRLTRTLGIDKSFYAEDLTTSSRIWLEHGPGEISYSSTPRIGVDYAGTPWKDKPWRFLLT
jgi:DNA-3-methyladenine glycosylase